MKVRKIKNLEQLKQKEFVIDTDNKGLVAVTVDTVEIANLTLGLFRCSIEGEEQEEEINKFVYENMEEILDMLCFEVEQTLEMLFMIFCRLDDSLIRTKLFFFIMRKRIDRLISLQIFGKFKSEVIDLFSKHKEE